MSPPGGSSSSSSASPDPLSVFLVKTGGRGGNRVLYRYPYKVATKRKEIPPHCSEYSLLRLNAAVADPSAAAADAKRKSLTAENLVLFENKYLAELFGVDPVVRDKKVELKVDGVRFVFHPRCVDPLDEEETLADALAKKVEVRDGDEDATSAEPSVASLSTSPRGEGKDGGQTDVSPASSAVVNMFVVVFALDAATDYAVVQSYHQLAKDIAQAIRNEQMRDGYLRREARIMIRAQDEVAAMSPEKKPSSPFSLVETRSELARDLTKAFQDIKHNGTLEMRFNGWSEVLFCLTQKVHKTVKPGLFVPPSLLKEMFKTIRPYHTMLLLKSKDETLSELPTDTPTIVARMVCESAPHKTIIKLAEDVDCSMKDVWEKACMLVFWGKATFIHPLCGSAQYVLSPEVAPTSPAIRDKYAEKFPEAKSLTYYLKLLSWPKPAEQLLDAWSSPKEIEELDSVLVWMLQNRIIHSMHKFVSLMVSDDGSCSALPDPRAPRAEDEPEIVVLAESDEAPDPKYPPVQSITEKEVAMGIEGEKIRASDDGEVLKGFSETEKATIRRSIGAESEEDLLMFSRLAPYFYHDYPLEAIMYWENLRRNQILYLCDRFTEVLDVETRPDPDIEDIRLGMRS